MYPANYCSSRLITICGATATGKSSLALALAKRLETMIISADSRQVYREFDIGTAKPSLQERQEVPHYLIDICEPAETLTVADYQQQAQKLIISPYPLLPPPASPAPPAS
ncbi:isopentenyl transferase family protein, partial [Aliterella atlantica]